MRIPFGLLLLLGACAPADGLETLEQASIGTTSNDIYSGMIRLSGASDYFGQGGYHTGMLAVRTVAGQDNYNSRLVMTAGTSLPLLWSGQCRPQLTAEHGFIYTGAPRNNPVRAQVTNWVSHLSLPIVLLQLDHGIDVVRPPARASGLPASGLDMKCVGYQSGGNLVTVRGTGRGPIGSNYLFESSFPQEIHTADPGYACTDAQYTQLYGLSFWDDDWRTNSTGFNEQITLAALDPWIQAQEGITSMFAPTQFTPMPLLRNSQNTGLCADVPDASFADVPINQYTCHGRLNQRWYQIGGWVFDLGTGGSSYRARFVNPYEGKCLTSGAGGVRQAACNLGDSRQSWEFIPMQTGTSALKNVSTGTCMELAPGGSGQQIRLATCPAAGSNAPGKTWSAGTGLTWCFP